MSSRRLALHAAALAREGAERAAAAGKQALKFLQPTNPRALGVYFAAIFALTAVAAVYLVSKTVTQIRNEASLSLRQRGEISLRRLNEKLSDILAKENHRSFSQYRYFMTIPSLNGGEDVVVSPLAAFPVRSDVPGLIGHFQIDPDGSFHSPILPEGVARHQTPPNLADRLRHWRTMKFIVEQHDLSGKTVVERVALRDVDQDYADTSADTAAAAGRAESQVISPEPRVEAPSKRQGQVFDAGARRRPDDAFTDVEIYPFEAAISGRYLIFHRIVLRGGARHIQGFFVNTQAFFIHIFQNEMDYDFVGELGFRLLHSRQRLLELGAWDNPDSEIVEYSLAWPFQEISLDVAFQKPRRSSATVAIVLLAGFFLLALGGAFLAIYRAVLSNLQIAQKHADFVSAVSHELRTPLTSIRLSSEMLESGMLPTEEKKMRHYRTISAEAERLSRLIQNILDFSKISRRRWTAKLAERDVNVLVREFEDTYRSTFAERQTKLVVHLCDGARVHLVDHDSFRQILINVTDNAVKFSKNAALREVDISTAPEERGGTRVSIRDYGAGVPDGELDKIFGDFYRVENELTRDTPGTGIGLSLVKNLCATMNVRIEVRNAEPGFEFTMHFPKLAIREEREDS